MSAPMQQNVLLELRVLTQLAATNACVLKVMSTITYQKNATVIIILNQKLNFSTKLIN